MGGGRAVATRRAGRAKPFTGGLHPLSRCDLLRANGKRPCRGNPRVRERAWPTPDQWLPLSRRGLAEGGIHRSAAAPRQAGGSGEGLALPRACFSPSRIAIWQGQVSKG